MTKLRRVDQQLLSRGEVEGCHAEHPVELLLDAAISIEFHGILRLT